MLNSVNSFYPRVVNPVKINQVLILSADEEVKKSGQVLEDQMPWVEVCVLSNPGEAEQVKRSQAFVLVCDDTGLNLLDTQKIRRRNKDVAVVLISAIDMIQCSPPSVSEEKYPYTKKADLIFASNKKDCTPARIITSVVRSAQDKLNIENYSKARRYIILVVDDEPRWISQFIPVLYDIIGQRAAVQIARTFEQAMEFLFGVRDESMINDSDYANKGYGDDVVCLISDIYFPRGGEMKPDVGADFIRLVDKYFPRFPKIIASKASEADDLRTTAFILPKGDPGSLKTLRNYIHDFTGMGDFVILSKEGKELERVKNTNEMIDIFNKAEKDTAYGRQLRQILEEYGRKDNFSTWLYMHGFKDLADKILPLRYKGQKMVAFLKQIFKKAMDNVKTTPLVIGDKEIFTLRELLDSLKTIKPEKIQKFSDNDYFSTWLDRLGYTELAEEIRPIHGRGVEVERTLAEIIEKWVTIYKNKHKNGKI